MADNQNIDLRDYIGVLVRRRVAFAITAAVVFALSMAVTFLWPATYSSTATILIEEQDIPADLVRSAVTSSAVQRIESISQQVMTRANLMRVVEKFDIYVEAREEGKTDKVLASMRKRITIDTLDVEAVDPSSGRPGQVTIAFTVSFEHGDPEIAQKVTQELASLFLDRNEQTRTARASGTLQFLTDEAGELGAQIADLEGKLATFKERNQSSLPELTDLNFQLMDKVERQFDGVEGQLRSLEERKHMLEGELALISPWNPMVSESGERVVDPVTLLRTLRAEYIGAAARYSARHPSVVRLGRQIDALEKQLGAIDGSEERAKTLARTRQELIAAQKNYAPDHPDVVNLRRTIAVLETLPEANTAEQPGASTIAGIEGDNPAYITLRARLRAVESELESLRGFRDQLAARLNDYEQRIAQAPQIERDYLSMRREYDSAMRRYQEIKDNQTDARVRRNLENQHAEQFSLIDPPQVAEEPIKPNRALLGFLGLLLSLTCGLGGAGVAEAWDTRSQPAEGTELDEAEQTIAELRREVALLKGIAQELPRPQSIGENTRRSRQ